MENQVVAQAPKKVTIGNFLNFPNTQKFLEDNLKENRKEFVSNLLALCDGDPNLALCEPNKLMMCAMNATALNLPLNKNLGYAYIIPYKGVPSFQIGYKGLIQLALRSGQYKFLNATEVREGEISRNKFTGEIKFLGENEDAKIIGYMACLELNNGFRASLYMTEAEIEKHAMRFSKMYVADKQYKTRKSKWSDPDARPKMAIKTVLKGLLGTYGVLSTEMVKAFANDDDNESEPTKSNGRTGDIEEAVIVQNEPELEPEKVEI
ncbi:MAG TPA: recombinase RecT [Flavobacterium sp.]|nr:recombinase RecT [Flavobacterium sp.]